MSISQQQENEDYTPKLRTLGKKKKHPRIKLEREKSV